MKTLIDYRPLLLVLLMGFFFISCSDELEDVTPQHASKVIPTAENASVANVVDTIKFEAVAQIAACHGESIRFWGNLVQRVVTVVDGQGKTHVTRHFRPTDLQAEGVTTKAKYDIVGGAEMFSIHADPGKAPTLMDSRIFIHQGTLVFVKEMDGSRVVARHTIRKVPGREEVVSMWDCGGK